MLLVVLDGMKLISVIKYKLINLYLIYRMSISNLFSPNTYDLFCDDLTIAGILTATIPAVSATGMGTFSGPWGLATLMAPFNIQRVGTLVIMRLGLIPLTAETGAAVVISDAFIPVSFRPVNNVTNTTTFNDANVKVISQAIIKSDGTMEFGDINGNAFSGFFSAGTDQLKIFTWHTLA
jgi:hypothetical protein